MILISPVTANPMRRIEFNGIELDVCPDTGGIWFDQGELGDLLHGSREDVEALDEAAKPEGRIDVDSRTESTRYCPRCNVPLYRYRYLHSTPIELDGCEGCGGVFVDDGELGAIAAVARRVGGRRLLPEEAAAALAELHVAEETYRSRWTLVERASKTLMIRIRPRI